MNNDKPDDDRTIVNPTSGSGGTQPPAAPRLPSRDDSGNALPLGTYLDEFELRSVAGEGGFSIVYRAWDHSLKRQVAVKEYFPSGMVARSGGTQVVVRSERHADAFEAGLKAFVKEAQLLAQFDHPALIKVFRFWRANGSAYMVMPFCEGITLRDDWRAKAEPPDELALMTLLDPLTEALSVFHAESWYHRDIAPDNVMLLAGTRRPLLLDFGAARQVIGDMTHALTVILKPGYAPIEQWGEVPGMKQGPWTDVYALAATIHFAITKRTPPPSVGRLINDSYEPLVQVAAGRYSERFLAAVDHALAVRPELRTQSVAQFRDEIGLNEFTRERTMTWMPGPGPGPAVASGMGSTLIPDLELPRTAPGQAGIEFTVQARPSSAARVEFEPRTQPMQPPPAPAPAARNPVLLFGVGLVVTGVLGLVGYSVLKPSPTLAIPTPERPASAVLAASAPASATEGVKPDIVPPPPLPPSFDAIADFNRIVQAQAPGHSVEVTMVRTTVRSEKDAIEFTVKSDVDGFLYVFNHGSDGALLQLYPNKWVPQPMVRKNVPLNLPKDNMPKGRTLSFNISGPSGPNQLLVIVSTHQRDHSAFSPRFEEGYAFYPTGNAASALSARHKGSVPWLAGVPKCPSSGPCNDQFGAAIATFNTVQ